MDKRMNLFAVVPDGYKMMLEFEKYVTATSVAKTHKELIKIRASQINGCAFCLDMHTKDARKNGETEQRIYTLSAWRDTPFFTEEEQVILALTEEVTQISNHVSDSTYNRAVAVLGEKYVAEVIVAILAINSWNRIAITTGMQPA
ncbi:carboxymuconolactone decarboxylase family protein [Flavobacterium sp. MFBS3-15]|uniref:carboxymuconolactone decarboxylase family protein n=1 Tax=Flavobacterium sp. MFBS3-15 TaxID=2989816 RepID=UPI0022365361|nr:carboxymuconolactone decarboxylase family protein [Flavobacterium sp. MFBS3-15]MCW4469321.1 carboxymuconolactone decarboxylase family protein [Flavobacterium sp. MFBS3-15]